MSTFEAKFHESKTAAEHAADNTQLGEYEIAVASDDRTVKIGPGFWNGLTAIGEGPKVYRATLTQSGTDAPEATVLENTLGGTPVISTPGDPGTHQITLEGAWPAGKVFCTGGVFPTDGYLISWGVQRNSNDILSFNVQKIFDNGGFALTPINDWPCTISLEILVYP